MTWSAVQPSFPAPQSQGQSGKGLAQAAAHLHATPFYIGSNTWLIVLPRCYFKVYRITLRLLVVDENQKEADPVESGEAPIEYLIYPNTVQVHMPAIHFLLNVPEEKGR